MNILAIDTSNQAMGIAILQEEVIIGEMVTNIKKNHSVRLLPAIDKLMKEVNMAPDELDKIVVAKGPGSYTGVRIGLSTAKSLAWSLNIPITGVSSLEVLVYQAKFFRELICPFFDARRGLVYTGLYEWQEEALHLVREEVNISMDIWLQRLKEDGQTVLFLSPDILVHKEKIISQLGELAVFPEAPYHLAKPSYLALAGMHKPADDTHLLTPNYLRLAEAEANWLKAQKGKQTYG